MYIKHHTYNNEFTSRLDPQTKMLRPLSEASIITDYDDKFGLENIKDYKKVLKHLNESGYKYDINDIVFFLRKLVEIYKTEGISKNELHKNQYFQKLINHVTTTLKLGNHYKYPHIGSLAHCFQSLQVEDQKLWEVLEYKINEDDWLTNFKESIFAIEGFTKHCQGKDQKRIDSIYKKIERIVNITVWEVDMTYYKRVVEALVSVNRAPPNLFDKIENHILNNLGMEYEVETIVDILFAFNKADRGSKKLYDSLQYTIHKGHLFNKNVMLPNRLELPFQGRVVSKLIEIYGKCIEREQEFTINPDFRAMVHKYLQNKKTLYELPDMVTTLSHIKLFEFEDLPQVENNIFEKILKIENPQIEEIVEFYEFMGENFPKVIRPEIRQHLEEKVISQMTNHKHNTSLVLYGARYFLEFNKEVFERHEELKRLCEQSLEQNFMQMEVPMIENYIQFFENNQLELKNEIKVKEFLKIAQINKQIFGANKKQKKYLSNF